MSHVLGTMLPDPSTSGQKRTWWPHGPGHPLLWSTVWLFLVSSLHSLSTLNPKAPVGTNEPAANCVGWLFLCGSSDCASWPSIVKSAVRVVVPFGYQRSVALFPCVWNALSCRTCTGTVGSARRQYGESTSSPTAVT